MWAEQGVGGWTQGRRGEWAGCPLTGVPSHRDVVQEATKMLRNAAGNFFINDKSTGSVVGQQPFGGSRASGEQVSLLVSLERVPRAFISRV